MGFHDILLNSMICPSCVPCDHAHALIIHKQLIEFHRFS